MKEYSFLFLLSILGFIFSLTSCSLKKVNFVNVQDINRFDYSKKKKNDCPVFEKGHGNFYFIIEKRNDQIMVLLPDLYIHYGVYWEKMPNQKIQNLLKKININERLWVRINCTPTTFNFPFNLENEPELMTYLTEDSNYDFENQKS